MSDFAQSGLISTFQQLNEAHLLEDELTALAREHPISLVLPCHGADLDRPALAHIAAELRGAAFLREIILSLNGVDAAGVSRAKTLFASLPQRVRILWNDGPGAAPLLKEFAPGKGLNVWNALGLICSEGGSEIVALQDCDVASFRRGTLARLCYACAHPKLDYAFAKLYYSRATDRLYGRVSRLFFAPLLHAIVRMAGHHPLLDFLLSFRYPLAGECAFKTKVAARLPINADWGLEIGMLCELFRQIDPRHICQVAGGGAYDHKHQPAAGALAAMSGQIARVLFEQLAKEGLDFQSGLTEAYRREALVAVHRSANLALINGLPFDEAGERAIVELFAAQLVTAAANSATLPAWTTMAQSAPDFLPRLLAAHAALD